ncbi:MAG: hypothetical protein JO019_04835 [Candidatus Kaiserbacteria bacterium]|nr:hypothetical protein [Candidatus Kaiserbacteria bacterium]
MPALLLACLLCGDAAYAALVEEPLNPLLMTPKQRFMAAEKAVSVATRCVIDKLAADHRFVEELHASGIKAEEVRPTPLCIPQRSRAGNGKATPLSNMIMHAINACGGAMRRVRETCDDLAGNGSGEKYVDAPYLDDLPTVVIHAIEELAGPP